MAASWFVSPSLKKLKAEIDAAWPGRSTAVDGFLGDAAHSARKSEHNANRDSKDAVPDGAVTAGDFTTEDIDFAKILKALKADPRTWYVIHAGFIYSSTYGFAKRRYTGPNPHTKHFHISLMQNAKAVNSTASWGINKAAPKPAPKPTPKPEPEKPLWERKPVLKRGSTGKDVALVQRFIGTPDDGIFGPATERQVKHYQGIVGLPKTGVVNAAMWKSILRSLKLA